MKPLLNVFREFNEIDLRNPRFGSKHDPVRFDTADRGVFVYLAVDGFEVPQPARVTLTELPRLRT